MEIVVFLPKTPALTPKNWRPMLLHIDALPAKNKGLLFLRLPMTERNAIVSPAISLLIFLTIIDCYEGYHVSRASWKSAVCSLLALYSMGFIFCASDITPILI
jgi:hypothetical protein